MTSTDSVVYKVKIIQRRDAMGQTNGDYHATVTRMTDSAQLIMIADWLWVMKLKTRRRAIERAFKRHDKRERKLNHEREFHI